MDHFFFINNYQPDKKFASIIELRIDKNKYHNVLSCKTFVLGLNDISYEKSTKKVNNKLVSHQKFAKKLENFEKCF